MNDQLERQRDRATQVAVEQEVKALAEQILVQVNRVNEIAHLLVSRIEGRTHDA